MPHPSSKPPLAELVALMATMSSLMALSIDAMLPALPLIGHDLGVVRANDNQLIISSLFLGMALGLLLYGPLSDSYGRKPPLYAGLGLYLVGCLVSIQAQDFNQMLVGRVIQGMGLAAPRVISLAIIRDLFHGEEMARVMSFVMMFFTLVPALAPSLGQAILLVAPWRAIFVLYLCLALLVLVWFGLRQPETLEPARRTPFTLARVFGAIGQVLKNLESLGPTLTLGIVFGAILGYLSTAQQIFQGLYDKGTQFPIYFGLMALVFGGASLVNSRLVQLFSIRQLSRWTLGGLTLLSLGFFFYTLSWEGVPPFWSFLAFLSLSFVCLAILFGNLNAMAMEPLGKMAGIGAAVVGTLSTILSAGLGTLIGQLYNETLIPLTVSFAALGTVSIVILSLTTKAGGRATAGPSVPH
ncbi:MAG: MFS transporter [Candidatus Lambdaproteobacteria bacterium RIFOXYD1_FULL_56_27]|uniref:Bcr/CflA family efflux transporter n=1 Tax=Candidatus Lambdaproteobacteria bacterium RIFOXYD2_FULL_56_26 TaxID=1817773 RepID=A0A1F6GTZ1_9PROT|nr:MAG: MFS transporter [Candidatus Lambdaproteobacteria bacterium RIFOXYC1_FULL_56_13]OGH01625.1 MAG: MFS transporter [Candidatus Lambdaproteobacteria bacterium RIFOXYD2_FULL_56_26]OGH07156.1 MAG: MFS transporter [Candidatus Lambdaproteobacteria bacterium RIFOXYD1_FULL_56_27]